MVILNKVYDLTEYNDYHPGGYEIMLEYAGTDVTNVFKDKPHTLQSYEILNSYLIGELIKVSH